MADPAKPCFPAASAVNGGAPATCAVTPAILSRSSRTSATASAEVLCIFQLPQTNLRRLIEHLHSGQLPPLEEFERSAAARGDVRHFVGETHLDDGRGAVAAAHHRGRSA